ncbi:MATE family efflux transporter [[Clostridium] symbiosum]|uniref:MATE family efflux transporter n=1 Tax=Clostridium symbiosum TaxID=1512 RepID=UPI001D086523|nr:MATE family efflux transporter [[Clostridium] symbiosum]MCB6607081.1 MATE family efflux transporter [[Clostridium] symbiosum]MCB6929641.1 MATE family efflux transporter [[Clostridium] symbiosum]
MRYQTDIDKMNTNRNLFFMSLPIFVELLLQLLVGNIDQMMVSRVSQQSVASIVNANQIMNLVIIVLSMAATATTVILSQYLGADDKDNSSRTCMVSLLMIGVVGILSTVLVFVGYRPIYKAIRVPDEIFDEASLYLLIVGAFITVQGLYLTFSAIIRAFAMMKEVMIVSIVMNVLNIIGNAILINGWFGMPRLGAVGAAISTDISKLVGLGLMILLFMKRTNVKLGMHFLKPFPTQIMKNLCFLAIPSGVESFSYNMSQMCILGIVNSFGTMVTVTKGYCSIFANLAYVYAMAIASATQIVLGYLIGAKKIDLIQKRVNATMKVALAACVGLAILLFLGSNYAFLIFTDNPEIIALGRRILFIEIFLEIGRAVNIVMTKCLIAVGDAVTPTAVGVIFQWGVAFVGAWVFGIIFGWGLEGVWVAMAIDECLRGLIFAVHFKKERWKKVFRSVDA